jgi:acyl-CoA oxidase
MGLLGVDNGRIWFDKKRIPRDNLLNKFGDVTPEGKYISAYDSNLKRFGAMVGKKNYKKLIFSTTDTAPLVGGRVLISAGALNAAKICLYIATKYSLQRKQFGKPGQETPIMSYLSHQRRIYPALAGIYVLQNGVNFLKEKYCKPDPTSADKKEVHILASGFKAVCTWHRTEAAQLARECCGGMGFGSRNRIGGLKADYDVDLTYEGDNHVLLQQVSRDLLVEFQKGKINVEPPVTDMGVVSHIFLI